MLVSKTPRQNRSSMSSTLRMHCCCIRQEPLMSGEWILLGASYDLPPSFFKSGPTDDKFSLLLPLVLTYPRSQAKKFDPRPSYWTERKRSGRTQNSRNLRVDARTTQTLLFAAFRDTLCVAQHKHGFPAEIALGQLFQSSPLSARAGKLEGRRETKKEKRFHPGGWTNPVVGTLECEKGFVSIPVEQLTREFTR